MKTQSRLGFLLAGLSLAAATFWKWRSRPAKNGRVKFLSREGKLVEVDVRKLAATRRPASKEEIQEWVNKK